MSSRQCARLIRNHLEQPDVRDLPGPQKAQSAATHLIERARSSPVCNDDATAVVVLLEKPE